MKEINRARLPGNIRFHRALVPDQLSRWARYAGCDPDELQAVSERVIRRCHEAALIDLKGAGRHPDIFKLGLGRLVVCYTVEADALVVRGYSPNLRADQTTPGDEGCWFGEYDWLAEEDA